MGCRARRDDELDDREEETVTTYAIDQSTTSTKLDAYRDAERSLWGRYGPEPTERLVAVHAPPARLRVLDTGSGAPLVFVHGTVGPGGWASLVHEFPGRRCIVLERPGWGLSSPIDYAQHEYKGVAADVLAQALDALGLGRVDVVGGSIGNVWALALAARHPSLVDKVVLLGGSPLVPESPVPGFIRMLSSPLGALLVRVGNSPERVRSILRANGHGASLEDGRIPQEFVDWRVAVGRDTSSMRNERAMVKTVVRGRTFHPGLTFDDAALAAIEAPTLYVYGDKDPVGSVDLWGRVAGALPVGEFHLVPGAGHMPWFDDASGVAGEIRRFLEQPSER